MSTEPSSPLPLTRTPPRVWSVGALCHAIADALDARFNPVRVSGEISGFVRAASGHCYFSLKDDSGQIKCAMFKRAAGGLDFAPRVFRLTLFDQFGQPLLGALLVRCAERDVGGFCFPRHPDSGSPQP